MNIITLLNAGRVFGQLMQVKTSPKLAYKIMKFCKGIEAEEEFYNNKRSEIIQMYATKDANGQPIIENGTVSIIEDKITEANAAMQELNNMDVDMPNVRFTLSELEELKLSASDMYALDDFIDGE